MTEIGTMTKAELSPEVKALLAKRFPAGAANGPSAADVEKAKDDVAQAHADARARAAAAAKAAKAETHGKRGKKHKQDDDAEEKVTPTSSDDAPATDAE